MIGAHGLVWSGAFDAEGVAHAARHAVDCGYDLLELPLLDPHGFDVAGAKRVLSPLDLQISASMGLPMGSDISSDDRDEVARGEAVLDRALDILGELGAQHLCGVLYGVLRKYPGPASARGRANSQEVLGRIADRAASLGITISLEVVDRYEANLFNTAGGALAYLDEIDASNIKIHLDTYHMNIEESDLFTPVLRAGERLGYVHIGESHRGYLGTGTVGFDAFFRALREVGYSGPITFESFSTAVVDPVLSRSLAIWRNLWEDGDDLARHANAFMRNKLRAVETLELH